MPKTKRARRSKRRHRTPYHHHSQRVLATINTDTTGTSSESCSSCCDDADSSYDDADSSQEQSLLFLFDLETTGLSVYTDSITEIAGKVFNPPVAVSNTSFSSLVYTSHDIPGIVQSITGITPDMLKDEEPLSIVLPRFLSWISNTTQEVTESTGLPHHPVLVAHNGNSYDFPLLLAEMQRITKSNKSTLAQLQQNRIFFADTLTFLRKEKREGSDFLAEQKLGLKNIYKLCFPDKSYQAHRALADVEAMEEILGHPQLDYLPACLPQQSASELMKSWNARNKLRKAKNK